MNKKWKWRTAAILLLLCFTGCQHFQRKPSEISTLPSWITQSRTHYTLDSLTFTHETLVEKSQWYYQLLTWMDQHPDSATWLVVPLSVYENISNVENGKLFNFQKVIEKPASELSDEEKAELQALYPQFFRFKIIDTQSYLKAQVYYIYTQLDTLHLFAKNEYYTEYDKAKLVVKLEKRNQYFGLMLKNSNWKLIPQLTKIEPMTSTLYQQVFVQQDKENQLLNTLQESGSSVVTFPWAIIENSQYHGYRIKNDKPIFLIGGEKADYPYPDYPIDITVQPITLDELMNISGDSVVFPWAMP